MSQINARDGVNGRKLKFQMMDDAYVPSRSVENVKAMLADSSIVALQTCVGTPNNAATLGMIEAAGSGMALTSVLPNVNSWKMPIVREYQAAMREGGITEFSGTGLEAYMNMRVMMAALERVGRGELTRAKLRTAIATLPKIDLGGFSVDFPQGSPFVGSHFVELGVLGSNGKMLV